MTQPDPTGGAAPTHAPSQARQVSVAAERLAPWLAGFTERHGPISCVFSAASVALTAADSARAWVDVPFPTSTSPTSTSPTSTSPTSTSPTDTGPTSTSPTDTGPTSAGPTNTGPTGAVDSLDALIAHVLRDRRVGVLLVRRAGHAAGLFDGARLVTSKVDSSYVQGTTKAGGWSQQRYARRRGNQTDAAFAHAADVGVRVLGEARNLDALVVGGDKEGVRVVLADRRLTHLPTPTGPWLTVKDPKLKILQAMPEQFRAVRIRLVP